MARLLPRNRSELILLYRGAHGGTGSAARKRSTVKSSLLAAYGRRRRGRTLWNIEDFTPKVLPEDFCVGPDTFDGQALGQKPAQTPGSIGSGSS